MKAGFSLRPRGNNPKTTAKKSTANKAHSFDILVQQGGEWTIWGDLDSTNLSRVRYHTAEHLLQIQFRSGPTYTYQNVPPHVYSGLLIASSPGKYFLTGIKPAFIGIKS